MIININQKYKELYESFFEITSDEKELGTIKVNGRLGSVVSTVKGSYNNIPFELNYIGKVFSKKYRPYQVKVSEKCVGEIYQTKIKKGFLSTEYQFELNYSNCIYKNYGVIIENKAMMLIYLNDEQVAQIDKDMTVYNDLHDFKIYIKSSKYDMIPIIFACYNYIMTFFKPGTKVTRSISRHYANTTDKNMLSRYNPQWIKKI